MVIISNAVSAGTMVGSMRESLNRPAARYASRKGSKVPLEDTPSAPRDTVTPASSISGILPTRVVPLARRNAAPGQYATRTLLGRMRASGALVDRVTALVEHHLAPALFVKNAATAKGYRRLARKLERAGVGIELLVRVARADHLGRTTADALAGRFDAGDVFLATARAHSVDHAAPRDAVLGRHLIARGMQPGPDFGPILERCREIQDETGWTDTDRILDHALAER